MMMFPKDENESRLFVVFDFGRFSWKASMPEPPGRVGISPGCYS